MKKTPLTKIIALLLILAMMLSLAVACGGSETTTETPVTTTPVESTEAPQTTETPTVTEAPQTTEQPAVTEPEVTTTATSLELAYPTQLNGIKDKVEDNAVQFIYIEAEDGIYTAKSLWADEENDPFLDAVDQQVIKRNKYIQEDLGVTIEAFTDYSLGIAGLYNFAKSFFDVQDPGVDVYCGFQYFDLQVALTGNILNLNTIVNDNNETIIDIEQPYWATNYINSITYNDHLYWVTGDVSLRYTGGLYCTYVNLDLYDKYVKSSYENKSIYDIVNEKKWTMQTMLDMAELVYEDTDDNSKASTGDRLGIVCRTGDIIDGLAFGCKINFSTADKDSIAITLHTDERANKLAGYVQTMFSSKFSYEASYTNMLSIFAQGNSLFTFEKLYSSSSDLGAMERLAIVPTPLLDESQDDYGSGTNDGLSIFGISRYSNCPIASAATLELMAYYGYHFVTPAYVESFLKGSETVRDPESAAMIDKIRAGLNADFAAAWSNNLNGISLIFRKDNVKSYSTIIQNNSKTWPSMLTKLLNDIEAADAQ